MASDATKVEVEASVLWLALHLNVSRQSLCSPYRLDLFEV